VGVKQLEHKVAIVTGSSSGIGAAIARRFAEEGAAVVVNSARSPDKGERVAAELPDAVYVQADVGEEADKLIAAALDRWGHLDILVNNAARSRLLPHPNLSDLTDDMWVDTFRVNLLGPWHLARAAAPHLREHGDGAIVNVTSVVGTRPTENGTAIPYHISKSGLNHLTVLLANALGPDIRVNAVAPGGIETPMWRAAADELRASVSARTILNRPGVPGEIAEACLFFARPGYVTGQVLAVDGGMSVKVQRDASRGGW
jgi:ketoreductase RED2